MKHLIIAIGFGIILGLSVFLVAKANPSASPFTLTGFNKPQPSVSVEQLTSGELTTTMADIINQGQNLECDWKIPFDGTKNPYATGKLWTTNNKGRSMIDTVVANEAIEANIIYIDTKAYAWTVTAGQKTGMTFTPTTLEEFNRSMSLQERQQAEQTRTSMLFNCDNWTPDESKFVLPSDVEFQEK